MPKHIAVLQNEIISLLKPKSNENFIDLTLGYGGHSKLILEKTAPNGKMLCVEQDENAILEAEITLEKFKNRITIINDNFIQIGLILRKWPHKTNGILLDLGPNTDQLSSNRGLSFSGSFPLDMRLDKTRQKITALDIVNRYSQKEITKILQNGEDRYAKTIAKKIVISRNITPINTTDQLVKIIKSAIPPFERFSKNTHFATATFRALRMEVNQELNNLHHVLPQAFSALNTSGRLAVISFHSLEDRIVKNYFKKIVQEEKAEILTPKPIEPKEDEISRNPSSRSAKLRVAIKISNS